MIWLAALVACGLLHRPAPPWPEDITVDRQRQAPIQAGMVSGGLFMDGTYPFWISVLPGWRALPGTADGALRVALHHPASGVRVEVWSFDGADLEPRQRQDCLWTFVSEGHYSVPKVPGDVVVATCMPDNPLTPRVFAYILERGGRVWQIEVHAPPDKLAGALVLGDELVETARWSR